MVSPVMVRRSSPNSAKAQNYFSFLTFEKMNFSRLIQDMQKIITKTFFELFPVQKGPQRPNSRQND